MAQKSGPANFRYEYTKTYVAPAYCDFYTLAIRFIRAVAIDSAFYASTAVPKAEKKDMNYPSAIAAPTDGAQKMLRPSAGGSVRLCLRLYLGLKRISIPKAVSVLVAIGLLLVWQLGSGSLFNAYYLSRPTAVMTQLAAWIADGYLWRHLSATLLNTGIGFALAAVAGTGAALLLGSVAILDRIFGPLIYLLYSLPKVVLAPLLILWVGIGPFPVILMAFITSFFMVFFNVYSGVRMANPVLLNAAALMGAGPLATALKVRLPAARASVALGMHQGLVYAFHGAIVGEMTSSDRGLGYALVYAGANMDANGVLAVLAVLGIVAFALLRVIGHLLQAKQEILK